jgi:hypothetical protein
MMQSAIIIYHAESLLEMQFMCLIVFAFVFKPFRHKDELIEVHQKSNHVLWVLIAEHIFAYVSGLFRTWEIKHFGEIDINGVARA